MAHGYHRELLVVGFWEGWSPVLYLYSTCPTKDSSL